MSRTARSLVAGLLLTVGLAACGSDDDGGAVAEGGDGSTETTTSETTVAPDDGSSDAAAGTDQVEIVDFAFDPVDVTVAAGTTVTWTNQDEAAHSISDSALDFESEDMAQGDTYEFTYEDPGEYPYVCGIHNYMKGTVTVE